MDDVQLAGIWLGDWSIYCFVWWVAYNTIDKCTMGFGWWVRVCKNVYFLFVLIRLVFNFNRLFNRRITMFGTSAKWIALIEEKKCEPKTTHKLEKLKCIFSTGSPLKPASFDYVYKSIKSDLVLGSITGKFNFFLIFLLSYQQFSILAIYLILILFRWHRYYILILRSKRKPTRIQRRNSM